MLGHRIIVCLATCMLAAASFAAQPQSVQLTVGSDEATLGEYVSIPVTLAGANTHPTCIVFKIGYDSSALLLDEDHVELGPAGMGGSFSQFIGQDRVSVLIAGFGSLIGDGVLCYLNFRVVSPDTGVYPLEFTEVSVTDSAASEIQAFVEDGQITINPRDEIPFQCRKDDEEQAAPAEATIASIPMLAVLATLAFGKRARKKTDK